MSSRGLRCGLTIVIVLLAFHPVGAQETSQAERDAMYHRYLAFASYVKGGSVEPHWMADGNSFWYAEHGPGETMFWKVDPVANTKQPLFDVDVPAPATSRTDEGPEIYVADMPFTRLIPYTNDWVVHRRVRGLSTPFQADPDTYMERLWVEEKR